MADSLSPQEVLISIQKSSNKESNAKTTDFQDQVYTLLLQIPSGRVTTYAHLSAALKSSPRAIGGALRRNPYAPQVPCHRVIATNMYVGGFMGDWKKAPSGINIEKKLKLLEGEGVRFDKKGFLAERFRVWSGFKKV